MSRAVRPPAKTTAVKRFPRLTRFARLVLATVTLLIIGTVMFNPGQAAAEKVCPDGSTVGDLVPCPGQTDVTVLCSDGKRYGIGVGCPVGTSTAKTCPDGSTVGVAVPCPGQTGNTTVCPDGRQVGIGVGCGDTGVTVKCADGTTVGIGVGCADRGGPAPTGGGGGGGRGTTYQGPSCAIKDYGPLAGCPPEAGVRGTNGCYVRDLKAENPNAWEKKGEQPCNVLPDFQSPFASADCSQNAQAKGCDTAASCTPGNAATGQAQRNTCDLSKDIINPTVKAVSALVGVGVTVAIVWAGIQYSSAGGNAAQVAAARKRILVAVLVLIGYMIFFAFFNWIVPGGIT